MNDFNDIQALWQQQSTTPDKNVEQIIKMAQQQKSQSIRKHVSGIIVLSVTLLILVLIWTITPFANPVSYGLSIMISSLMLRILLEGYSYNRIKRIDIAEVSEVYQQKIKAFFSFRKYLVSLVTAITLLAYIGGFILMVPTFKQTLPNWFYWYIIVFLIIGIPLSAYLLFRQARKEIKDLERVIEKL